MRAGARRGSIGRVSDLGRGGSDPRIYGLQIGTVIDREDPESLWRVRVKIPGLLDEPGTTWAWPMGSFGGGGPGGGGWRVPPLGADVGVLFLQGDPSRPYYLPGWWGKPKGESEIPVDARDLSPAESPQVTAIETERLAIAIDERPGSRALRIRDKVSDDAIEWDLEAMGIRIKATSGVLIESDGIVDIRGLQIIINGRVVTDLPKGI